MENQTSRGLSLLGLAIASLLIYASFSTSMEAFRNIELIFRKLPPTIKVGKGVFFMPGAAPAFMALWIMSFISFLKIKLTRNAVNGLMLVGIVSAFLAFGGRIIGSLALDYQLTEAGYVFCHHDPDSTSIKYRDEIWALDADLCPPTSYK